MTVAEQPRRAASNSPKSDPPKFIRPEVVDKTPIWSPWLGAGMTLLAVFVLRFTGFGLKLAMTGMIIGVLTAYICWNKTNKRIGLLIAPAAAALVTFFVYLALPHGMVVGVGPSLTNPYKSQQTQGDPDMFGNAYGNGTGQSNQTGTDQGYDPSAGDDPVGQPNDSSGCGQEACGFEEDGSHPEATIPPGTPTAEMDQAERLALWAELNPEGSGPADPKAGDDNDVWFDWVNYYLYELPHSVYKPNHGEYWVSFGAAADPHGDLVAVPAPGSTQAQHYSFMEDPTEWVGGKGDTTRSVICDVRTNYGEILEGVQVHMELVELKDGRSVVLASLAA